MTKAVWSLCMLLYAYVCVTSPNQALGFRGIFCDIYKNNITEHAMFTCVHF